MLRWLFGSKRPSLQDATLRLYAIHLQLRHCRTAPSEAVQTALREQYGEERLIAVLQAMNLERAQKGAALRSSPVWAVLSDAERHFVEIPVQELTEQERRNVSWLMEGAAVLLWALSLADAIPPYDQEAPFALFETLPSGKTPTYIPGAKLRPQGELETARSLAELWHWRARTRQLQEAGGHEKNLPPGFTFPRIIALAAQAAHKRGAIASPLGDDFPAFGRAYRDASADDFARLLSIALERHRALNWLVGRAAGHHWAETPVDT